LASSGVNKVIDAGSGLMLFEGNSTKDAVSFANSNLLTNSDGTKVFELDGYKASAVTTVGSVTQVWFVGGTASNTSYLAQAFDDVGRAVGSAQIVAGQSFTDAQRLGVAATNAQIALEQANDINHTNLLPSDGLNHNTQG
jgi:hypothetical protein